MLYRHRPRHRNHLAGLRVYWTRRAKRRRFALQPEAYGPLPPCGHQLGKARLSLAPARVQRGHLRRRRRIRKIPLIEKPENLSPSSRERVEKVLAVAREFESRRPPDELRCDREAQSHQPRRKLVAVIGADQLRIPPDQGRLHAPPGPRPGPRHVGQDAVGMELGVEIPARQVPESRNCHALSRNPRPLPCLRVPAAGLKQFLLDPVERLVHRLVMGADDPPVAPDQRFERDRLGGGQRDVPARTVHMLAVALASQPDVGSRYMA